MRKSNKITNKTNLLSNSASNFWNPETLKVVFDAVNKEIDKKIIKNIRKSISKKKK